MDAFSVLSILSSFLQINSIYPSTICVLARIIVASERERGGHDEASSAVQVLHDGYVPVEGCSHVHDAIMHELNRSKA